MREPRPSSRPVRDASGNVSRFDAEIGDRLPDGSTLSQRAWLEAMQAVGWTEFAADGWVRCVRWVSVAEALGTLAPDPSKEDA